VEWKTTGNWNPVTATTNAYTHSGLANGTTYYYRVSACNAAGCGNTSSQITAIPVGANSITSATAGNTQVTVNWTAATGATIYSLKISGGKTATISNLTGTSYIDTGLTNGTTYTYSIAGCNSTGCGPYYSSVNATPVAPATLTGITIRKGAATVTVPGVTPPSPMNCTPAPTGTEVNSLTITMNTSTKEQFCAYALYSNGTSKGINGTPPSTYEYTNYNGTFRWSQNNANAGTLNTVPLTYGLFTTILEATTVRTTIVTYNYKPSAGVAKSEKFTIKVFPQAANVNQN
ncbi:MAG: fibronectin type III domain-containing protein, partial [archaeon]